MKATTFKLFATMITLAAVITATTIPAQAQRRSTKSSSERSEPDRNRNLKNTVQKKSTFKDNAKTSRSRVNSNLKSTRSVPQKTSSSATRNSINNKRNTTFRNQQSSRSSYSSAQSINKSRQQSNSRATVSKPSSKPVYTTSRGGSSDLNKNTIRNQSQRQYASLKTNSNTSRETTQRSSGANVRNSREFYQVNKRDKRYTPNNNYKGSRNYWSNSHRGKKNKHHKANYKQKHYNYNKHNHWNNNWEHYRWNQNSWRDYYNGYQTRSYVYHKHYYHHKHYGHVIRRFDYRPQVFVHNHHNYYSYNGNFFRYRRGVGYVLVDIPFGMSFEYLPGNYEQVYINGYAYYRVGNLFFEWANFGFRLVHYPDRYYAYNDDYCNQGYHFNDDYYYNY